MHIVRSIIEGLRIIGFDKLSIKKVGREKDLEDSFLSNLFLNYLLVLIIYTVGILIGGYKIQGKILNPVVLNSFLMIYPFIFNLSIYVIYGLFGVFAELLDSKNRVKPLLSVGYHTGLVFSVLFYFFFLISMINLPYGLFLFSAFSIYFILLMIYSTHVLYNFSVNQSIILILTPFLVLGILLIFFLIVWPESFKFLISLFI